MKFLWITDPWKTLDHPRDTSLRLAEESLSLGHESWWCDVHSIAADGGRGSVVARKILEVEPGRAAFRLGPARRMRPDDFGSLQYRVDPPVDLAYLQPLQLLVSCVSRAEIVNPAPVLLGANEKLEGWALRGLAPPGVASSSREALSAFGRAQGRAVLKPLYEAQSKGVQLLDWRRGEPVAALRRATFGWTRPVLLQKFLPAIAEGEQRLWFVDGKFLASVAKLPLAGDFRVNLDRGSRVAVRSLSRRDRAACARVGKHLRAMGVRLAAVDLIDGLVTDFNFTSPGLIVQMEAVLGENLARAVVRGLVR